MFIVMSPPYMNIFPEAGTLVSTFCSGTTKMGKYHDGNGGTYDSAIQTNSAECGYVPPPAAGTLLSTYCSGSNKMGRYADGGGGTYDATIQVNSTECGYVPGLEGGGGALRVNVAWTGSTDVDIVVSSPDGFTYGYGKQGGGNGKWDHDSVNAGQENVAWNPTAPNGTYTVQLKNYSGADPGTITVTIILNGVTKTVSMSGYLPAVAGSVSTRNTQFAIQGGSFSQNPYLA
jgi:hypothetical protein